MTHERGNKIGELVRGLPEKWPATIMYMAFAALAGMNLESTGQKIYKLAYTYS